VVSRRTLAITKSKTREVIKEKDEQHDIEFAYNSLVETETNTNEIKSFYDLMKDPRKDQPTLKLCASGREESLSKKLQKPTQMVSGKFEYVRQRASAVLEAEITAIKLPPAGINRANCY
jgi:hypothetical protein